MYVLLLVVTPVVQIVILPGSNVDYCFHPLCPSTQGVVLGRQAVNILSGKYLSKVLDVETWSGYHSEVLQVPCQSVT